MPSFAGIDLGLVITCTTRSTPPEFQQNAYPAQNGVEMLFGGTRGLFTHVSGVYGGVGLGGLAVVRETLRSLRNGQAAVFVDTTGTSWLSTVLMAFDPQDRISTDPSGFCTQPYTAEFFHPYG